MKTYARVQNSIVQEIVGPVTDDLGNEIAIGDRFTPDLVLQMVDVTGVSPQPACWWTYNGTVFSAPPSAAEPSPAQLAANAMVAGVAIMSTGTPAINGTYAVDQLSQMDIIAIETSLNAGKGFPGGSASFNYADMSGTFHSFTAASFTDFAAAVRDYVYALKAVIAGASTQLPSPSAAIA